MARSTTHSPATIPVQTARRLLLGRQGLLAVPARRASPAAILKLIGQMGYVQIDTINIVQRAHHHILMTRFDDYQPRMLTKLLERDRTLFEHWTHDAAAIPTAWYRYWQLRFTRFARRWREHPWWKERMGGKPEQVLAHVLDRIDREGPLMSKDFQHDGAGRGPWWGWKPQKAALDYLWITGKLAIAGRVNFHKVYDLAERVFPQMQGLAAPEEDETHDWACRAALERLVTATPGELAGFFDALDSKEAARWCREAVGAGEIEPVLVESADGSRPRPAFALPGWRSRASRLPDPPRRMRLVSPFDPVLRDRKRAVRLFGFDYRFEAFVPEARRRYGYYVLPILQGDLFVGRADAKLHRDRAELEIKGLWWERGVKPTRRLRASLEEAVDRLAGQLGAEFWVLPGY